MRFVTLACLEPEMEASLIASLDAGIKAGMGEFRKITVQVPEGVLEKAQAYTGEGVTQTVTAALKRLASIHAQQELLKLRGKVKFALSPEQLREDRD
jgi:hypothetical protein